MAGAIDLQHTNEYRKGLACAIASVVLVSIAQLAMKFGMMHAPSAVLADMHSLRDFFGSLIAAPANAIPPLILPLILPIMAGLFCYAISVLCWMAALARLPLNLAYPLLSLSYPLVYLGAAFLPYFNEALNMQRIAGIGLIMLGVILLMLTPKTVRSTATDISALKSNR